MEGIPNRLFVSRYQLYLPNREQMQQQLDLLLNKIDKNSRE